MNWGEIIIMVLEQFKSKPIFNHIENAFIDEIMISIFVYLEIEAFILNQKYHIYANRNKL